MLRNFLLVCAGLFFLASCYAVITDAQAWPATLTSAALVVAFAARRRFYGAPHPEKPGDGWHATGERFYDEGSSELVDVWFDPVSGTRRYVRSPDSRR